MHSSTHWLTPLFLTLTGPALAGGVPVFLGLPGDHGNVCIYDEDAAAAPVFPANLQNIRLLPIEVAGRSQLTEFLPDRARLLQDVPNASRARLPHGVGSLYGFLRPGPGAVTVQGLMFVDALGDARSVFELPVPASGQLPFDDALAIAPDGASVLISTSKAAGGNLLELDLASGVLVDRTANLPPLELSGLASGLQSDWGVGIESSGVVRFARLAGGSAEFVPFSAPAPSWFAPELVFSANGEHAATVAGDDPSATYPWVFSKDGLALAAGNSPAELVGAGLLPGAQGGPWLAVSDEGDLCAWRTGSGHAASGELYVGRVPASPQDPSVHVTVDAVFEPYLDEIGQYVFTPGGKLVFGAGDADYFGQGLSNMDLFELSWPAGAAWTVRNLSLSSGEAQPPFLAPPTIDPERIVWIPDSQSLLVLSGAMGDAQILEVESGQVGATLIAADPDGFELITIQEETGGIYLEQESQGPGSGGLRSVELPYEGELPETVGSLVPGDVYLRGLVDEASEQLVYVTGNGLSETIWKVDLDEEGTPIALTDRPLVYGPTLGIAPGGAVTLSVGTLGAPSLFIAWRKSGSPLRLDPEPKVGFLLPGA